MKVVDMHCDTLYEMEKNHLSLSENNLNIVNISLSTRFFFVPG